MRAHPPRATHSLCGTSCKLQSWEETNLSIFLRYYCPDCNVEFLRMEEAHPQGTPTREISGRKRGWS